MSTPSITILKLGDCDQLWQVLDADCDTTVEKDIASGPCTLLSVSVTTVQDDSAKKDFYLNVSDDIKPTISQTKPTEVVNIPSLYASADIHYNEVVLLNLSTCLYFEKGLSFSGSTGDDQSVNPLGTGSPTAVVVTLLLIPGAR